MKRTEWRARCVAALAAVVAGCAGATRLASVWTEPAVEANSLRRLMVIGVSLNATTRRVFEDRFATTLQAQGIMAEPSYPLVGAGRDLDSARLGAEMHRTACDGVLVVRLVDQTTVQTNYAPPNGPVGVPRQYLFGWYDYYTVAYANLASPRYSHENEVVQFESNLYRVADGRLVWSALSQEWLGPADMPGASVEHLVAQVVKALRDARIVASGATAG